MSNNREWMYQRKDGHGAIRDEYAEGVSTFIQYALTQPSYMNGSLVLCPCTKCHNENYLESTTIRYHLLKFGFVSNYQEWYLHGEPYIPQPARERNIVNNPSTNSFPNPQNSFDDMLIDLGDNVFIHENPEELPNLYAQKFFDMLKECGVPLWKGCSISKLEAVARPMHIEKNVFENFFNTIMDIKEKTKDNAKSRKDLLEHCDRPELNKDIRTGLYPPAIYTLAKPAKKVLCDWLNKIRFPDGYVSNLSRRVDMAKLKLYSLKSHDCHVFMQRLLPVAFRELLPSEVWEPITELSLFFKKLTTTNISVQDMTRLEAQIPVILCKLETIFPPSVFDSMEHVPIHLPYEARIAGPVQYRWMYPFERFIRKLKNNVKNKARVEGSIRNAYIVEEAATFCSHYFDSQVMTKGRRIPRNYDGGVENNIEGNLSIFTHPGRSYGKAKERRMYPKEIEAAQTYILLNCPEVEIYVNMYIDQIRNENPGISDVHLDKILESNISKWFCEYGQNNFIENKFIKDLSKGPLDFAMSYGTYHVNGYKFQTETQCSTRSTVNSGVCIKGSNDFYGRIEEILELEYPALPIKRVVLFMCHWFDPTPNTGTKVHPTYNLVDVNQRRKYNKYEPFILASQASQVTYLSYPSLRRNMSDWLFVCNIKARATVIAPAAIPQVSSSDLALQEDDEPTVDDDSFERLRLSKLL